MREDSQVFFLQQVINGESVDNTVLEMLFRSAVLAHVAAVSFKYILVI